MFAVCNKNMDSEIIRKVLGLIIIHVTRMAFPERSTKASKNMRWSTNVSMRAINLNLHWKIGTFFCNKGMAVNMSLL